jgi:predicted kinase
MSDEPSSIGRVLVLTGAPGVGKSTIAAALAGRVARGAHVEADVVHRFIVSGGQWPSAGTDESYRQLLLRASNIATISQTLRAAGFCVVIDEAVALPEQLEAIEAVVTPPIDIVVLTATEDAILARDGQRAKQTARSYLGVQAMVLQLLQSRAHVIDTTTRAIDESVFAVQEAVDW